MPEILIAVLAGVLTIGAPCILPLLPVLLGSSVGHTNKARPLFITTGFVISFAAVSLLITFITNKLGIDPNTLRTIAIFTLGIFGLFMVWPKPFELLTLRLSGIIQKANQMGLKAGPSNLGEFVLGLTLGVIWTPCAGPVLGSILTLIATSVNMVQAGILLIAYAIGAGVPMLLIAYGGQYVTTKVRWIARYSRQIQQLFGLVIILLTVAMYFQYDALLQAKLIEYYPSSQLKY